jgi:hypothetical protein
MTQSPSVCGSVLYDSNVNAKAKLPGPLATTLKRGKPAWQPRSA